MVVKGFNELELAGRGLNGWKWFEMALTGWNRKMVGNGLNFWKWMEIASNGHIGWKQLE